MQALRNFSISGVGKYLPEKRVSNQELEQQLQLPENWISKFIGVENRHVATHESNTEMGVRALREALKSANMEISDLGCLIAASATFDYIIPNRSVLIKHAFEEANELDFPCIDVNTVCTSFITAMDYAAYLIASGTYSNIAIVTSEISSKGLNPANKETFCLFGDAAAAVILSATDQPGGAIRYLQKTYAQGAMDTLIQGGGNQFHARDYPYDPARNSFKMEGRKLLAATQKKLPGYFEEFFREIPFTLSSVDWILPHQASKLGLKLLAKWNGEKTDNIVDQLADYGNCIAASVPLTLVTSIESGKIKAGDTCLLVGTAAGLTIAGLLLTYVPK